MKRPEETLQRALVDRLLGPLDREGRRMRALGALPKPWLVFHVPNGGGRSKAEAGIFKAMGVLAGMPDLFVVGPGPEQHALRGMITRAWPHVIALEIKAPPKPLKRGGVSKAKPAVSEAQREVIEALGQCGIPTLIVRDLDECLRALTQLGVPLNGRQM